MPVGTSGNPGNTFLRSLNSGAVLRAVIQHGPISRAAIARHTNLTNVTVGAIAADLLEQDLITDSGKTASTAGRPGRLLELNATAYLAVGVKLSDHSLSCFFTDLRANVVATKTVALTAPTPADLVLSLSSLVSDLLQETGFARERLLGVGIGLPGVIDSEAGIARYSPFLRWVDVPVVELVEEALELPTFIENDVNTLALTERWFGRGVDVQDFMLVTLGQGIGLGLVLDGALYRGRRGGVGELGHTVVSDSAQVCECGNTGCLEAIASEVALLSEAAQVCVDAGLAPVSDFNDLNRRAEDEPELMVLIDRAAQVVGRGIANMVNALSPELVLIHGVGEFVGSTFARRIASAVHASVFPGLAGNYQLEFGPLEDIRWAQGAASLVLSELFVAPGILTEPRTRTWKSQR